MSQAKNKLPLFVDLDGTLIRSDVSFESFLALLKKSPFYFFAMLFWMIQGKPYLKKKIAERVSIDAKLLPYVKELLDFLKQEKAEGRKLILASASESGIVERVAQEVGIFDGTIGTKLDKNLSGKNKLQAIREYCAEHDLGDDFGYAGNAEVDFAIWEGSKERVLITDSQSFYRKATKRFTFIFELLLKGKNKSIFKTLRIHQWSKNILLFVPVVMGHHMLEIPFLFPALLAFISFSLSASAIYIVNDLFDLEADRMHHIKRMRPLASGSMQAKTAFLLIPILLAGSFGIAALLPQEFGFCLLLYVATTTLYSFSLKRIAVLDVITLAMLYVLRLFAGGLATKIYVSQWLLSFSLFLFSSLACLKRFSELRLLKEDNIAKAYGRGYKSDDIIPISQFGAASGYLAVFVLVFYINSKEVLALYHKQNILWFLCPLIMYWITRIWLLAYRGKVHEDPVVFALQDRVSYLVGLAVLSLMLLAV